MLPRQNKNSTKHSVKKDEDSPSEDADDFLSVVNKGKTSSSKQSTVSASQAKPAGQFQLNQQKPLSFPSNLNANSQPPESLFSNTYSSSEPNNGAKLMKDVVNTQNRGQQLHNNFFKPANQVYQPAAYQGGNVTAQRTQNGKENIANTQYQNTNSGGSGPKPPPVSNQQTSYIDSFKARNEEDLLMLNQRHQQLVNLILSQEEEVLSVHRQQVDNMVDCVKQEMALLNEVEKPSSNIDEYIDNLDAILLHKLDMITMLRDRIHKFKGILKEEQAVSKKFYEQKNEMMDIFDLNSGENFKNDDLQLLDDLNQVMS